MKFIVPFLMTLLLFGCGGGDSSSGGGGVFAGTYSGSGSATLSAPGAPSNVVGFTFTVTINVAGVVTYTDSAGGFFTGTMVGNSFSLNPRGSKIFGLSSCTNTVSLAGTINGINLVGTISGNNVVCFGVPAQPLTVTGSFSGTSS